MGDEKGFADDWPNAEVAVFPKPGVLKVAAAVDWPAGAGPPLSPNW